jgi:putative solute:sodium symporter small subunit
MPQSNDPPPMPMRRYWRRNLVLTGVLITAWLLLTFVPAYFARELTFNFVGWPFAFWMAAYGAPLCYLVLVVVYARLMNRADVQVSGKAKRSD